MKLNLKNIEELIFFDTQARALLPEFRHLFDQWQLGQRISGMKTLGQRSVLELINSLESHHIEKLEEYFSDKIILDKIDTRIVANYQFNLDQPNNLCEFSGFIDMCAYRTENKVFVSFWK